MSHTLQRIVGVGQRRRQESATLFTFQKERLIARFPVNGNDKDTVDERHDVFCCLTYHGLHDGSHILQGRAVFDGNHGQSLDVLPALTYQETAIHQDVVGERRAKILRPGHTNRFKEDRKIFC